MWVITKFSLESSCSLVELQLVFVSAAYPLTSTMEKNIESVTYDTNVGTQQESQNIPTLSIRLEKTTGINRERDIFNMEITLNKLLKKL